MTADTPGNAMVITLRAMKFDALVGILDHERERAQPIEVDLSLTVRPPGGKTDTHNILDYRHAYQAVSEILASGHIDYLEEAAGRIAERALSLPLVLGVSVAVRKMKVALPGPLDYAEVKIERANA